jgi:hypothetical protein
MFVWEEKFAPKANMECISSIASPVLSIGDIWPLAFFVSSSRKN